MDKQAVKTQNLPGLLNYQEGAVVSKAIIDKPTGTVTLFAFAKSEGLSEHAAPFDALVYVLEGQAEVVVSGEKYNLSPNEMIIMPADSPHSLRAVTDFKMLLIMIRS
ncbi:MAG: cupin domain-containing protein [bacterium]|nr:cupin domain-containing protein [bacterium]